MTNMTNYRVVAREGGTEAFDIVHEAMPGPGGCGDTLLTTQNVSIQTLSDLVHKHSMTCKRH